ncbi:hypothetical protein NE237_028689 [Protea cynaroides]|uniref:IST1-like protein n=1 Tax=Protea cynaroides TaxID=273540 RepID=A0A9Q0JUB7_9MAGN|nr:hypothetical protein NE237_028689 [Protea cynaroides]
MLHKSFKSGKCKTSLKLAVARIKLLKNKRDAQVKQLKRELAQLLEAGQEKTARIRVEHVVREEKTLAAYDLLDIYCELIVARLPIIESQKSCPIDLKEAVASVIFAAPRCADVPELLDVRKQFTAKYGKEFVTSALELRPNCGVGRMMVEKLSAKAPDGETKIKILTAIAQEHKINWDPASLGDNDLKPPEDLLNGPSNFEIASKKTVEPPNVRLPPDHKYESSTNMPDNNVSISSLGSQVYASTESSSHTRMNPTFSPEPKASESRTMGQEYGRPSSRDENILPPDRQYWNMEFKDATSAAEAAAESAERASMAARAAVELSSRGNIMRQHSTESNKSSVYGFRNEGSRTSGPKSQEPVTMDSAEVVQDSPESSSDIVSRRRQNQPRDRKETLPGVSENKFGGEASVKRRPSKSLSSDSSISSLDDETSVVSSQKSDRYYEKRSSTVESISTSWQDGNPENTDYVDEESVKRRSSQSEVESFYHQPQNKGSEYTDISGDGRTRKQFSRSSSHMSADGDHDDVIPNEDLKHWHDDDDNSLFSNDRGSVQVGAEQSVLFDESGSDDDHNFDLGAKYNEHESSFYFPSPIRESPSHLSTEKNTWNPRENRGEFLEKKPSAEEHFVTEPEPPFKSFEQQTKSGVHSQSDDLAPVAFDDSDGLSSESEEDNLHINGKRGSSTGLHTQNSFPRSPSSSQNDWSHSLTASSIRKEVAGTNRKVILQSLSDNLESKEAQLDRNQEVKVGFVGDSSEKYGFTDTPTPQRSSGHRKSMKSLDDSAAEPFPRPVIEEQLLQSSKFSSAKEIEAEENPSTLDTHNILNSESGLGLNLRNLTGGYRNKGYQRPPYTRAPLGDTSLLSRSQSTEDSSTSIEQPSVSPMKKTPLGSGTRNQEPYNQKMHAKGHKESSSIASKTFFDSDSDDTIEEPRRQTIGIERPSESWMKKKTLGSGIHNQEPYNQKMHTKAHKGSSSIASKAIFDSDSDDANEEPPHQTVGIERLSVSPMKKTPLGFGNRNQESYNQKMHTKAHKGSSSIASKAICDSDTDDANEESPRQTVGIERQSVIPMKKTPLGSGTRNQEPYNQKMHTKAHKGSSSIASKAITDSDSDDANEEPPRQTVDRSYIGGRHSRRTKDFPKHSETSTPSRLSYGSEVAATPDSGRRRNTSRSSPAAEPLWKPQSELMRSGNAEDSKLSETNTPVQQKPSKPIAESKSTVHQETSKFSQPSSTVDQLSNVSETLPQTTSLGSSGSPNTSSTSGGSASRENSVKKDGHVHPKLPDYDRLAAHFHSLRSNRRGT